MFHEGQTPNRPDRSGLHSPHRHRLPVAGRLPLRRRPNQENRHRQRPFQEFRPSLPGQERGYFKAQGLDLALTTDASALESIRDLNSGRVDLACSGAFDFVQEVFGGASEPRCLSVLAEGQIFSVTARPDQGVGRPEDLRGKTIGTIGGTTAEIFLARFLIMHQIPYKEVTVVDLPPSEMARALATGQVNTVMLPDRTFYSVKQVFGDRALVWPAQAGQDIYSLMLTRQDFLPNQPGP